MWPRWTHSTSKPRQRAERNAMPVVWYKHGPDRSWGCSFIHPPLWKCTGTKLAMEQAEAMMRGDHSDILWRNVERAARRLVWC